MCRLIAWLRKPRTLARPERRIRITAWGVEHDVRQHGRDDLRLLASTIRRAP